MGGEASRFGRGWKEEPDSEGEYYPWWVAIGYSRVVWQLFFRMICGPSHRNPVVFLTEETTKIAPILKKAPAVNRELVAKWVVHWRETGFID